MNIITTLLFFSYITFTISEPKVTVGRTKIFGTFMYTRKHRQISAFRGIPYAEPPIGNLRYRDKSLFLKEFNTKLYFYYVSFSILN